MANLQDTNKTLQDTNKTLQDIDNTVKNTTDDVDKLTQKSAEAQKTVKKQNSEFKSDLSETDEELQVATQRLQDINKKIQKIKENFKNTTDRELKNIYSEGLSKYKREAEELNKKIEELNKVKEETKKGVSSIKNWSGTGKSSSSLKDINLLDNFFDTGKSSSSLKDTNKQLDNVSNKTKSAADGMANLGSKINQVSNDIGKINNSKLDNLANKTTSEANGIDKLDSKVNQVSNDIGKINNSQLDNLANKAVSASDKIESLSSRVNTLYNDIVNVNNVTKNTDVNGLDITTHESFREEIKKIEELKNKVADAKIGNVDTSKVAELEKEYGAINNSTLQTKMNEAVAQNNLKSYIDYAKGLKKYINSIIKLMTNTKTDDEKYERNLSEYFSGNSRVNEYGYGTPLRPYGIKVRAATDEDKTLLDNDSRVILNDTIFELNEDKLKEVGDEYTSAIKEFINSLAKFKELSKEMSSTSALNSTSPRRFLTAQGEIADEFKNILGITGKEEAKSFIEDVTTKSVSYTVDGKTINKRIKQMQIPDDPKLNMFDKTNIERLEGFTDEKGEHLGYKGITKELEDVVKELLRSFAKVANFTPGLASQDAIGGIHGPYGIGYTGTDLFKRLSYGSWVESNSKDNNLGDINSFAKNNNLDIKNMPITAIKQFDELGRTIEEIKGRFTELGISLPNSNDREYENDTLKGKRLGDQDEIDSAGYKISNTEYLDSIAKDEAVKYSANIKDNMKEADKNAAEAAANLKNIVSEQITKTGLLKSIVNDDEERASLQYSFAGGANQSAYATSSTKSGAVIHWGQARDQVKEIDSLQDEVELAYKDVENIFKYGRFNELLKPVDDFTSYKPIEYLNDKLTKMMQSVQSFDKSSYAQSASTPGKDNTVLFDKQKYLDFADKISKMTKALMDNENFQNYGNTQESLSQISQNIDEVTKSVESGRKSDVGNKLNSEYLKNTLKESFLTKELEAREENLNSGLLAGADLTNAQKKIEQIKLELNGARQALESVNKEAENNGISLEAATNKAEILKETYWDIARALGSTADADKFFSQVKSLSQITKDNLLGIADQFGDKLTDIDMSYIAEQLKKAKNDLGLLTGGGYERSLSSSIRGSKGLSRAEQEPVRYQNEAIREQLNNARLAMTGSYEAFEEVHKNLSVEEIKTGIDNIKQSLTNTSNKLNELGDSDTADALKSQLINFKDRLGRLQLEFDKVTQGLTESSNIGQLRTVFENSKTLGNSLNTLNAQVELAANDAKQSSEADRQKAYDKYNQQRQSDAQRIESIKTQFGERESLISGMDTQGLDKAIDRIRILKAELEKALEAGNTSRASAVWDAYISATDKIIGKSREVEEAQKRQAEAEKAHQEAIKSLLEETKNYVSKQEALNNKPMSYNDQAAYYDQQLSKFKEDTREYIEVLKLKNQAENKAAEEAQRAADIQKKAYDKYAQQRQADAQTINSIRTQFGERESLISGIDTQGLDKAIDRIRILKTELEKALETGNASRASAIWDAYISATDKVVGKGREVEEAQKRQADAEKTHQEAIKRLFEETKNYVSTQEALTNTPMPYADQAAYYDQQLSKFKEDTREYIEVLKLKNQAENKAAEETQKAAEKEEQAKQDAIKRLFEETKNYVSTQEALTNQPMAYSDQAAYYEQQLSKFEEGTREYIEVLKLKNQAENKAAEETKKAAEEEEKAHLEALEAAKQRVTGILSTIKSFADGINNAVNKIVQIIRTGISLINKVISGATKFIVTIGHGIRTIITLFGNLGNHVKSSLLGVSEGSEKVNGSFNILKGSATELRSKILLLKGAFDGIFNNELVKKAENLMASVYSLQNIAGPKLTQEVLDWANAMEYAFGLSAKGLIGDINELTGVLYGLGMNAKDTALGSENILMMSRYLAFMGAAGGDANVVMQKLVSGMKGMTQSIDDLGLSALEGEMNAFLKSLKAQGGEFAGIATDFSSLNQEAKAYVRYASIIRQFTNKYDITNFADALTTVTGNMQILKDSASSLMTTLGTGFTKVLAKLATYIIPVINLIEQLVTKIFGLFGIDVRMTTDINEGTAALSDLGDGLDDTKKKIDKVGESAKKAGGNLQSFDRINNVTSSKSKSGNGGDDDFDYSKLMVSMLDGINEIAFKQQESYYDKLLKNLKNKLAKIKQSLIDFAKDITGREDFNLGFDWPKIKENLKTIFDNIVATIKSWGSFVIEIVLKVADDVNIGLIITKLTDLLAKASEVAKVLTDVLIPAFRDFYDIALSPIVKYIGEEAVKAIDFMIEELDKWQKWFEDNKDTILQFFTDLAEIVNEAWEVIKPFLDASWDKIGDAISELGEKLRNALNSLMDNTSENKPAIIEWIQNELPGIIDNGIKKIKEFWDALRGKESIDTVVENQGTAWGEFLQILMHINSIAQALVQIIEDLAGAFGEFAKNELLPWINEKLGELGEWLNQNKDKIVDFITKIASVTWEGFKIFVDLLGKLIDYVVQNPDSVFKFFEALIGLKVASWFTSTAASIGMALVGLQGLTSFASGAGSTLSGLFGGAGAAGAGAAGAGATGGAAGAAGAASGAAGAASGAAGAASGAAGGAATAGGIALGPILAVTAAVVILIATVKDLWDTSESFRQAINDIWDDIVEAFDKAKEKISEAFDNIKGALDNLYKTYENSGLKSIIEDLVTLIAKGLGFAISSAIDLIGNLFSTIGNLLADIINIVAGVIDIFGGLADIVIGVFTNDWDKVNQGWDKIANGLFEIVQGLIQGIIDVIGGVVGEFIDIGNRLTDGLLKGISDAWQGLIKSVKVLIANFIKAVKDFFGIHSPSKVFAEIGDFLVQGLLQGIQDTWTAFSEAVIGIFEGLIKGIESTFSNIGKFFSTTFNNAKELAIRAWSNANEKFTEVKNRVASAFDGLKENVRTTFKTAKENAVSVWNDAKSRFTNVADNIASGLASIKSKAREIFVNVRNSASNILSGIGNQLSNAWDGVKTKVSSGWNYVTGNIKATTGRKITSHAVGGSIAGGQLFIANENGNAELIGNIDGSGKTNVANNNMIMQAMESGIFEAVYNAMAEVMNQRGTVGNSGNTTIKLDGFGLIDASTLRELARILAPYLRSNDINIADTQFSI